MHTVFRPLLVVVLGCGLAPAAFAQPPSDLSPAEMLKRADADGDGTVSRDEFIKSRTAMLEERFARMDADGDGKLDEQEVAAAAEEMRSRAGGRDGLRPAGPHARPHAQFSARRQHVRILGSEPRRRRDDDDVTDAGHLRRAL